jgi:hypothetical protein
MNTATQAQKETLAKIETRPYFLSANMWKDRMYVNIKKENSFRGDRALKIWIAKDGKLNIEEGRGTLHSKTSNQVKDLEIIFGFRSEEMRGDDSEGFWG